MASMDRVATLLLLLLVLLHGHLTQSMCPKKQDLHPCNCYNFSTYDRVECRAVDNGQVLKNSLSSLRCSHVLEFELSLCDIRDVPPDAFSEVRVSELYTYMANFSGVSRGCNMFHGFDDTLYMIEMKKAISLDVWDWSTMGRLNNLQRVYIFSSNFPRIDHRFSSISKSLTHLMIQGGDLGLIEAGAFAGLQLRDLEISYTKLETLTRAIFPVPATSLGVLSLRHNNIRFLPEDMFVEMPMLSLLDLSANQLRTLSERTISPVIRNLRLLDLSNNPYYCDCNLTWVSEAFNNPSNNDRFWQRKDITCHRPLPLQDVDVLKITHETLGCPRVVP